MPRQTVRALPAIEPIVPVLYPVPFDGPEWLFEPKYDGFRGLLYLTGRECRFRSKRATGYVASTSSATGSERSSSSAT